MNSPKKFRFALYFFILIPLFTGTAELETDPIWVRFHLAAEFLTVLALVAGGIGLMTEQIWCRDLFLIAVGMLLYTVILSPGHLSREMNGQISQILGFEEEHC